MSTQYINTRTATATRNSSDDALEPREFQLLLEATYELDDHYDIESRLIVLLAGRLGLRAGEIVHMKSSWVDDRRGMIEIPNHEPCTKGRDGGPCGYCRQLARQQEDYNDDIDAEEAMAERWTPKTPSAARSVPFTFNPKIEIVLERYFSRFDEFQTSKSGINRRLNRCVERVDELDGDNIYPHCLRATAATYHASRGLDAISLQSMMGWADLQTAHRYVKRSGERTKNALRAAHG